MKRLKMSTVRIGLLLAMASAALVMPLNASPNNNNDDNGVIQKLFLAGTRIGALDTRVPGNDLIKTAPGGPGAVIEPNTTEFTTALWKSAPLTKAHVLLPGSVTLNLLVKNYSENLGPADVFFSKRIRLPTDPPTGPGSILVATGAFENPFPAVGSGTCPPSFVSGQSPPAAGCAPQGVMTMTATSLILTPLTIPAGSVEELRIWCPGASFIGAFWNAQFLGTFSTLTEPKCPAEDDDDNDGLHNSNELLLGLLLNDSDSDDDGIVDGNDDSNGNGVHDEDEDDDDDECPDPDDDNDGVHDEDEDDDD